MYSDVCPVAYSGLKWALALLSHPPNCPSRVLSIGSRRMQQRHPRQPNDRPPINSTHYFHINPLDASPTLNNTYNYKQQHQ